MHILTQGQAILFLLIYGAMMLGVTLYVNYKHGKRQNAVENMPEFLLASRGVGIIPGAMSIAASWIWAPALFLSSQKAFDQGLPGAFWFIFPNLLALMVFAPFALRIRKLLPQGFTLPQFIRERHGTGVHRLYMFQFVVLQLCSFAVQILAGGMLIHELSGLSALTGRAILIGIVLIYAIIGGLRASVVTDYIHIITIFVVAAVTIPLVIWNAGGTSSIAIGAGGFAGKHFDLFEFAIFFSFGISTTVGLLSGPIGDQMHWQRAYALKSDKEVIKTFGLAACIFIMVPLSLSLLGFVAAGQYFSGTWKVASNQMIGPATVYHFAPYMSIPFTVMLLSGLCSTLDSILCAMSSLTVIDILNRPDDSNLSKAVSRGNLRSARMAMLPPAAIGFCIATIPHLSIQDLFLFYGTVRASTMIPRWQLCCGQPFAVEQCSVQSCYHCFSGHRF